MTIPPYLEKEAHFESFSLRPSALTAKHQTTMARIVSLLALFGTFQTALAAYKPRTILYERNLPETMTTAPTMPNPAKGKGVPAKGGSGGKKASYADLYDIENEIHKMLEPTGSPVYSSTTSAPQKAATASPIYYSKGKKFDARQKLSLAYPPMGQWYTCT